MNKISRTIKILLVTLIVGGVAFIPSTTHAAEGFFDGSVVNIVNGLFANISYLFLTITSWLVLVSGIFLSFSINLTTHIGGFFNSIPALKDVWIVVRNLSSIFIIFFLLYASIRTILGDNTSQVKSLVGKIILAGLLINFSLFFTKLLIDASNLVSLQFYRAIAPNSSEEADAKKVFTDGGLSDVFMSSLKIPTIYQNKGTLAATSVTASITVATFGGIIMMIVAAISFFAAAIAFSVRTAVLLFVMALSPLYFAGMIFPEVKEKADELLKLFKGQLLFMPAYLFLMYVALRLISSPGFTALFNQAAGTASTPDDTYGPRFAGIIVQYVIAIIFINAPLVVAIKMGAIGAKWAPDAKSVAGFFGQHTAGRFAKNLQGRVANSTWATKLPNVATWTNKGLSQVSGGTFGGSKGGYKKRYDDYVKERTEFAKKLKTPDTESKPYILAEMSKYDTENNYKATTQGLKDQLAQAKATRRRIQDRIDDPNISDLDKDVELERLKQHNKETDKLEEELKKVEKARNEKETEVKKQGEGLRAAEFARNLPGPSVILGSAAARAEAASNILKTLKKGDRDKLLDMIENATKEDKKEEKPAAPAAPKP